MARSRIALIVLALLLLASIGVAQAQTEATEVVQPPSGLLIYNVWVRPTAPAPADGATPEPPLPGTISGAYMTIENTSAEDYQLVGVSDAIAEMTMLHEMTLDAKGVMRMPMITSLDIPAGKTVVLDANGYHAMLMNVSSDIYPGEAIALLLTFADKTGATFDVPVAAIATDTPPADDPLIVANASSIKNEDGTLRTTLILDNRGDQADTLTGVLSAYVTASTTPVDVPAHSQTVVNHMALEAGAPRKANAFPLTLFFDSGKQITIAVPVQTSGAGS